MQCSQSFSFLSTLFLSIFLLSADRVHAMQSTSSDTVLWDDAYDRGISALNKQDYCAARKQFDLISKQSQNRVAQAKAWVSLADLYREGRGGKRDAVCAKEFFKQAANQEFDKAAQARAQFGLGEMYRLGQGGNKNVKTACCLFSLAAEQKINVSAQFAAKASLGECYRNGLGTEKDYARAKELLVEAAIQTENRKAKAKACAALGDLYRLGQGVPINYRQAHMFFKKAARQTDNVSAQAMACYNLGRLYYEGLGSKVDYVQARQFFEQAAQQAENMSARAGAQAILGLMYFLGQGGSDILVEEAQAILSEAVQQVDNKAAKARAQTYLAKLLEEKVKRERDLWRNGSGVSIRSEEALQTDLIKARSLNEEAAHQTYDLEAQALAQRQLEFVFTERRDGDRTMADQQCLAPPPSYSSLSSLYPVAPLLLNSSQNESSLTLSLLEQHNSLYPALATSSAHVQDGLENPPVYDSLFF